MFSFTFSNPYGFLIAFIPGLINFALVGYILYALPKNRIINVFALLTLCNGLWQLNDSFERISANAETADLLDTFFSIAWIFVGSLCFHFAILYSKEIRINLSRKFLALIYLPGFIFAGLYQSHFYKHYYEFIPFWGWVNFHNKNLLEALQIYWIAALVIGTVVILFYNTFKIKKDTLHKYQSLLISLGIAVPALCGIITQFIFPIWLNMPAIPVTSTFMTAFSIFTVIALNKYNLFSLSDLVSTESLMGSLPIMVFSVSVTKRLTFMNAVGKELLGIQKKDISKLITDELFIFGSEADKKNFFDVIQRTLKNEQIEMIESSIVTVKGKIDILLSASPIINNNKVQGVLFTAKDITELKQSTQLIAKNEALLAEAQQIAHVGSWEWDITSDTITCSDELYRIYGFEQDEIPVNHKAFLENIAPGERDTVYRIFMQAAKDHRPFSFYHRITRNKDVIIYTQGKVTCDENNNAVRLNGTCQDVTELIAKEETLKARNEELQKINDELDKFVYSVSHDLRAPLTSILGIVEISESETDDVLMLERLNLIKANISRLDIFILDVLDYSKNARIDIQADEINFKELLDEVTCNLKFMNTTEPMVDIQVNMVSKKPFRSDKSRISIIMNNLISNAIRYKDPYAEKPFVKIETDISEKHATIKVSDNGIGIKKEFHNKIFEMFYRVSENSIGSGLGLYLVKETVKKLDGEVTLHSDLGKGTTFVIHLPNI